MYIKTIIGGDFGYGHSSLLPEFFPLHSYIDAMWTYYQNQRPAHTRKWLKDKNYRIIGFHTPRFWYVDNTNLERCGLKIKYENILPRKVPFIIKPSKQAADIDGIGENFDSDNTEDFHNDLSEENVEDEFTPNEEITDENLIFFNDKIN